MMIPPTTTTQKIHTTRNRQRTTNNSDEATNRHPGSNEISYFHRRRLREPRTGTADTGGGGRWGSSSATSASVRTESSTKDFVNANAFRHIAPG